MCQGVGDTVCASEGGRSGAARSSDGGALSREEVRGAEHVSHGLRKLEESDGVPPRVVHATRARQLPRYGAVRLDLHLGRGFRDEARARCSEVRGTWRERGGSETRRNLAKPGDAIEGGGRGPGSVPPRA